MVGPRQFGECPLGLEVVDRPGAYAVVLDETASHVLAVRWRGRLFLPGGGIDDGESPLDALAREVLEETGRALLSADPIGQADQYVPDPATQRCWNKRCSFFRVRLGARVREPAEPAHHLAWVTTHEAARLLHEPASAWAVGAATSAGKGVDTGTDAVDVGGLRIAFRRAGNGPPLLLLHGAFGDSRAWRRQLEGLSDEFEVVAWDAPGCGASQDPPEAFGRAEYGECLAGFVAAVGLDRPHVLGLSLGSVIALELYRRFPSIPRSLVLASAYAGWAGSLPPEEVERRVQHAERDLQLPPERWVADYLPTFFSGAVAQEVVDEAVTLMLDTRPAGLRAALRAFGTADLREVLPRIAVPTLLLYGEADERSPLHVAQELHARVPASTLRVIPGAGHDSAMEAPGAFNEEVRRFLRLIDEVPATTP